MQRDRRNFSTLDWAFTAVIIVSPIALFVSWFFVQQTVVPPNRPFPENSIVTSPLQLTQDGQGIEAVLLLDWAPSYPVNHPGGEGRVTEVYVAPGQVLKSGQRIYQVDGVDVFTFASEIPPYRLIDSESDAEEILYVNKFLAEVTELDPEGDKWSTTTNEALRSFAEKRGIGHEPIGFDPRWVAWLPNETVVIDQVLAIKGAHIGSGSEPVLKLSPNLVSARLTESTDMTGDFEVRFADLVGTVNERREVSADFIHDLAELLNEDTSEIRVNLISRDPRSVITVPSSAVVVGPEGSTCIYQRKPLPGEGETYIPTRVEVVGGAPGATYLKEQGVPLELDVVLNPLILSEAAECDAT